MFADRARGAVPSFERVVIETSRLADPDPVLQTFATDRGLGRELHLGTLNAAPVGVAVGGEIEPSSVLDEPASPRSAPTSATPSIRAGSAASRYSLRSRRPGRHSSRRWRC